MYYSKNSYLIAYLRRGRVRISSFPDVGRVEEVTNHRVPLEHDLVHSAWKRYLKEHDRKGI